MRHPRLVRQRQPLVLGLVQARVAMHYETLPRADGVRGFLSVYSQFQPQLCLLESDLILEDIINGKTCDRLSVSRLSFSDQQSHVGFVLRGTPMSHHLAD